MVEDEDLLLAVLNSSPVVDGTPQDRLEGEAGRSITARFGGTSSAAERRNLRHARNALQDAVRKQGDMRERLSASLRGATLVPEVTTTGVRWELRASADELLAARVVIAWSRVEKQLPGRLRACANTECNLFLVDHSRPGTAKWCSMAACGNRMKARNHAIRVQQRVP